ncbi:hypothetical protein TraAM80_02679 [Trypanosoma rangeli]|uniref:Uncharacterized protein n=1 Tax=Trypanosoma rangeli TaxID=5698 RepID=A0A422NSU6_TRYRA|nr:uncharacterized protein TraAM80_02679 [Trypanosoma rangeli]RNF08572.1 hypothetical protein TraAM80_02679 [Trypanosoma rangeli]|eukprot:RNF08572.1 hypothetical protein TraAM80_02679 [Trypanosoma rangeli]
MGHAREHQTTHNHREVLLMRRRIESFIMVFSVIVVAFLVLIVSIHQGEASCQSRADAATYSVYAQATRKNDTLVGDLVAALKRNGVRAEPLEETDKTQRIDVFDTQEGTLLASGFRLLRLLGQFDVMWQLRYLEQSICWPRRTISMEALPNVDSERVSYHVTAINTRGGRAFLYKADVLTRERDRITTFPELQSLFPGFNAQTASPRMLVTNSMNVSTKFAAELHYGLSPLDIELRMEQRKPVTGEAAYWRVTVSTTNIMAEANLVKMHGIVSELVVNKSVLCPAAKCRAIFDDPFLQS